jgi:succinate-semialdehyde dehydrogenase/glutarate-semialdehyde dehydrogenase
VTKPPTVNPLNIVRLHELLEQAGGPVGVIQCVTVHCPRRAGERPSIAQINFTGNTETGISIAENAAKNPDSVHFLARGQ